MERIINICGQNYQNSETRYRCSQCENNCQGSCDKCLDKIHFGELRRYNCDNIVNFYVCQYTYKYSSEFQILMDSIPQISLLERYDVMSIGCGPCTDLWGIINFLEDTGQKKELFYVGFDLNDIWRPVQNQISSILAGTDYSVRFIHKDIFKVVDKLKISPGKWTPNILSLQYVISDMVKYNSRKEIESFIDNVVDRIVSYMEDNSFILINDINHNTQSRDYYEYMFNSIQEKLVRSTCSRFHFPMDKRHYEYGIEHRSNELCVNIPRSIRLRYNPWTVCSSAQMVIHIRK